MFDLIKRTAGSINCLLRAGVTYGGAFLAGERAEAPLDLTVTSTNDRLTAIISVACL